MTKLLALGCLLLFFSCSKKTNNDKIEFGAKTKELMKIVESNPEVKNLLLASIEKAKELNPDTISNPVQSLKAYYQFVTMTEKAMPWRLLEVDYANSLYDKIDQSLAYLTYLNDVPLRELEGKGYFNNSLQYVDPYKSWLTDFNKSWGKFLDTKESWNSNYYQMALADGIFGIQNGWYEDSSNWKTFNQFFARHLKSPDKRPIAEPHNNAVVVSAADAKPEGVWKIDSNSIVIEKEGVAVKSFTLRDVTQLIGTESEYENEFTNGTFTHSFLDVGDYHRYHFPLNGVIKEVRIIPGESVSGGYVTWDSVNKRYKFDPSSIGWQSLETRGCVILETEYGLVALLPIGMFPVSSVNFEKNVQVGTKVLKGDMLGYFLFGGSDFIMIFQNKVQFNLDALTQEGDGSSYKHLLMGEQIGHLSKKHM